MNRDTIKESEIVYIKRLRNMSGGDKLEIASSLFEAVKEIAKAGIRHQNPGISRSRLDKELKRRLAE